MFEPDELIVVHYPRSTHIRVAQPDFQRRELVVKRVRDLVRQPLTVHEFCCRLNIRRSRWLIVGREARTGYWRQFYIGTTREFWRVTPMRIGLYHPDTGRLAKIIGRPFEDTPRDRIILARAAQIWSRRDLGSFHLRIFCDDLRKVG